MGSHKDYHCKQNGSLPRLLVCTAHIPLTRPSKCGKSNCLVSNTTPVRLRAGTLPAPGKRDGEDDGLNQGLSQGLSQSRCVGHSHVPDGHRWAGCEERRSRHGGTVQDIHPYRPDSLYLILPTHVLFFYVTYPIIRRPSPLLARSTSAIDPKHDLEFKGFSVAAGKESRSIRGQLSFGISTRTTRAQLVDGAGAGLLAC